MEALVITLREGIEAALVLGIILAYLRKTGRMALSRQVYVGLGLALAASLAVAVVFQAIGFDPENEFLEGIMLGLAALFVAGMVFWMWRTARGIKGEMEQRLQEITSAEASKVQAGGLGLLLFTFFMVFREGVETVIFLWATALGEEASVLDLVAGAIGLALAVLFAVLFIRGSLRINLARFFNVTGLVLLILAAKLLAGSAHEFGEVGVIPLTKEIMAVLGYFVRDSSATAIVMALIAVPIFLLLCESIKQKAPRPASVIAETAADRRKRLAAVRLERFWQIGLAGATLLIILALGGTAFAGGTFVDPEPEAVAASAGAIHIPLSGLEEGVLRKFAFNSDGVEIRFLVARLKDGSHVTAVDACQICGAAGYGQEGPVAICKNCNAPIAMDTFGIGGGCNPLPLAAKVQASDIVVSVADLAGAKAVFAKK